MFILFFKKQKVEISTFFVYKRLILHLKNSVKIAMIREEFPPEGSLYQGGISDGWQYQIRFAGSKLQSSLDMIRAFLDEEGYEDVPLPRTTEELLHFRLPTKQQQIALFGDNGYVHNPVKILFDPTERTTKTLILCIFDENAENHLLRFHGKII